MGVMGVRPRTSLSIFVAALTVLTGVANAAPADGQAVSVDDFAWLTGTWRGPGPAGATAEIQYMAPEAHVLPAFFRLYRPDSVLVMEAVSLTKEQDGLFMYVRHFDPALVPMEEEHAIRLRLTGILRDTFVFENANEGENPTRTVMVRTVSGFTAWSELRRADGTTDTIRVEYRRVAPRRENGSADGVSGHRGVEHHRDGHGVGRRHVLLRRRGDDPRVVWLHQVVAGRNADHEPAIGVRLEMEHRLAVLREREAGVDRRRGGR